MQINTFRIISQSRNCKRAEVVTKLEGKSRTLHCQVVGGVPTYVRTELGYAPGDYGQVVVEKMEFVPSA